MALLLLLLCYIRRVLRAEDVCYVTDFSGNPEVRCSEEFEKMYLGNVLSNKE